MQKTRIYLSPPHVGPSERELLLNAFDSNWIAPLGPHVDAFEKEMCEFLGVKNATALSSGTAAIHLALRMLDVKRGDTVLCSSLTFAASANPIAYEGATPVFVDCDAESWNLCPRSLEAAIVDLRKKGVQPKALVAVNLYGQSARYDQILPICERYGLPVIEDAAESLGATYQGKATGRFGLIGAFSFNGNKIITTSGGGMLVSDHPEYAKKARFLATQAREPVHYYEHKEIGFNYRLSNLLAALGRAQLAGLPAKIDRRRAIFERYRTELGQLPGVGFMPELPGARSTRWLSVMLLDPRKARGTRDAMISALMERGIEARAVWKPMHLQPVFKGAAHYAVADRPVSEELFENGVCLPSGSTLTESEQAEVIETCRRLLT